MTGAPMLLTAPGCMAEHPAPAATLAPAHHPLSPNDASDVAEAELSMIEAEKWLRDAVERLGRVGERSGEALALSRAVGLILSDAAWRREGARGLFEAAQAAIEGKEEAA